MVQLVPAKAGELTGTSSDICGLAVLAGVWLRASEAEISAALWAHVAQEGLSFLSQGLCFASLH